MTASFVFDVEGQATYGMADLRPERTGLPSIVFISQRDDARHTDRLKAHGFKETKDSIANKLNEGGYAGGFSSPV